MKHYSGHNPEYGCGLMFVIVLTALAIGCVVTLAIVIIGPIHV
jgi:hypothetical protein